MKTHYLQQAFKFLIFRNNNSLVVILFKLISFSLNSRKIKSQDAGSSFEDKHENVEKPPEPPKVVEPPQDLLKISTEEMKKKQAKKDEDPKITKFKNAEVRNFIF